MRILLATAVAIAPLMAASGAQAEVVISNNRTSPIATANATGTAADNIRLANGGSITVNSGAAVTVNSSNSVDLDSGSQITMGNAANGATGILVNGGNTADITIGGAISITDSINSDTDTDTDKDGDPDGPWATGGDRYGLRVVGASPLTGDILVEAGSSILVEGADSAAISIEAPLVGDLTMLGTLNVTGDDSYGLRTTGPISGDVVVGGTIGVRGENAVGVSVEGAVAGGVVVQSNITASGYRFTTAPPVRPDGFEETPDNDKNILLLDELDEDDLLQGGPAVQIAADVTGGVVFDTAPTYGPGGIDGDDDGDGVKNGDEDDDGDGTKNRADTDRDGDGILDAAEGTATIASFGAAPAVLIGSDSRSITLGAAGTGDSAYGLINRGTLSGQGVYAGVDATGLQLGGNAGQTVVVEGGVRNEGSISAVALEGDATGVRIGLGTTTPTFINSGVVTSTVGGEEEARGAAVQIDAGASLPSLSNSGTVLATAAVGGDVDVFGVRDLSGTLTSITNTGVIQTRRGVNDEGSVGDGAAVAVDVTANTTGVTYLQNGVVGGVSDSNPDSDGDGVPDSREPRTIGELRFGSGADFMDIRNGSVVGDMSFGAGADRLSITGGAEVSGAVTDSDGLLDINIADGTLAAGQLTSTTISSLNIGAEGNLIVTLDPAAGDAGGFNVTGTATLADGAGLGVRFNSLLQQPDRFTLIEAGQLIAGDLNLDSFEANSPYLYVVQGGIDAAEGVVFADVRRRTADEANLLPVEASMYDAFYGALERDASVRNAFLSQSGRDEFINLYEQLLPEHSGGPLLSLASGVDAVTRALTGRNASAAPGETSAWVQEINFYADKDRTDTYGFRSEGFGVAGGVERGSGLGAMGLSVAFTSSELEDPESEAEEVLSANLLELGLYWRAQGQHWTTWARAAAGYATFESERRLIGAGLNLSNTSEWNGFTLAAAGGASYERNFGRFSIRPEIYAEYFSLSEDGHVEEGGGDGFDLEIDDREGHLFSTTAAINFGMAMGEDSWLRPELRVGWRQNISVDPGETIARFRSGGPDFTLSPDTIEGGGPIVGLRLNVGNELGMLSVSADAEMIDDYVRYMLFLRASFRF
jgi:hypothetical protein